MTVLITLNARKETGTTSAKAARAAGSVPGVIYGDHVESRHVTFSTEALKQLARIESGTLFDVQIEGEKEPVKVILHEQSHHPVTDKLEHIDLYQVRMDRELHTEIPIVFEGVAPAVKDLGGTLVRAYDHLPITCLPGDLVHNVVADVSTLKTFDDSIRVKDLGLPETVRTSLNEQDMVANVTPPRTEEELASLNEETKEDLESVEVAGKDKQDDDAGDAAGGDETPEKADKKEDA